MAFEISTRARIIAAATVVLGVGVATTFAAFSDSGDVRTELASGTLDLKFDDAQDGNPDAYLIEFDGGSSLVPGATVSRDLVVYNSGSVEADLDLALPVVVNSAGSPAEALQDALLLEIRDDESGAVLYTGPLSGATFADFEVPRAATPEDGATLVLTATLPAEATIAVAGQTLDITFSFPAEQAV